MSAVDPLLIELLRHGREETYLEYKGNVSWEDRNKQLEIIQTIMAFANENGGGTIIVGVEDDGTTVGLSDANYATFDHDRINQSLRGKTNQPINCKVINSEIDENGLKKFVFIQVGETQEFPLIYVADTVRKNQDSPADTRNIALRKSALYVRNKLQNGNKEIETLEEWKDIIERTSKKYQRETLRRYTIVGEKSPNPFDEELKI